METQELALAPYVPSPPTQPKPVESYIGSIASIISYSEVRYEGVVGFVSLQTTTLELLNVICYGTEGRRRKDGMQIPPLNKVFEYIKFNGNEIKEIQVRPPTSLTKGVKQSNAAKPPRPPSGSKRRQKVQLFTDENLENRQASLVVEGSSVNDNRLQIASSNPYAQPQPQPQVPGSYFHNPINYPQYIRYVPPHQAPISSVSPYQAPISSVSPYQVPINSVSPYQAPINSVSPYQAPINSSYWPSPHQSEPMHPPINQSQSFFTTFLVVPISLPPENGSSDFEAMKNMKQYDIWNYEGKEKPIAKPRNQYGPIARPSKPRYTNPYEEMMSDYLKLGQHLQQQQPLNYIGDGEYN